jgi:hypothetical protein
MTAVQPGIAVCIIGAIAIGYTPTVLINNLITHNGLLFMGLGGLAGALTYIA